MIIGYERVFVIAGNHEYYHKTTEGTRQLIEKFCTEAGENVYSCFDRVFHIPCPISTSKTVIAEEDTEQVTEEKEEGIMVKLLATTLWSEIEDKNVRKCARGVSDYSTIKSTATKERLNPEETVSWHRQSVQWLQRELAQDPEMPTVVLTHHAPSMACSEPDIPASEPIAQCFCSHLHHLFVHPLVLWAFGHTHFPLDCQWAATRVVSNPAGYPKSEFPLPYGRPYRPSLVLSLQQQQESSSSPSSSSSLCLTN